MFIAKTETNKDKSNIRQKENAIDDMLKVKAEKNSTFLSKVSDAINKSVFPRIKAMEEMETN